MAMTNKTWIVVADRAMAKFFQTSPESDRIYLVDTMENPDARLNADAFTEDKPGRSFDSMSPNRHSYSKEETIEEQLTHQFAQLISQRLYKERSTNKFKDLILIIEPKLLGKLRSSLDAATAHIVRDSINKNLVTLSEVQLEEYLKPHFPKLKANRRVLS